jgi:hypothetical protein
MAEQKCPYHVDHANRIERLEVHVDKLQETVKDPRVYVAVFSLIATIVSTIGSVVGTFIGVYAKSRGWF